jgi:hypothetical protein
MRSFAVFAIVLGTACGGGSDEERKVQPPQPPTPVAEKPAANGHIEPALIQRVVRGHFDVLRKCYEDGMRRDVNLKGRVVTKFIIDRDGTVSFVADGGSDMPDPKTVDCVVKKFGAFVFPKPEGGAVTVVYPIMFNPGDDGDAGVDAGA